MLGRLLQTAAAPFQGPAPRTQTPLESIQEESHTRELLFPDIVALKAAQQFGGYVSTVRPPPPTPKEAGSYDNRGGLDGINQDDIRIMIAQDTCGGWQSPQILFDSKKDDAKQSSRYDADIAKKQNLSARGKSMTSPLQPVRRVHTPSSSAFARPVPPSPSTPKSPEPRGLFGQPRITRQPMPDPFIELESRNEKEETDALLNCMFGAAGFRLQAGTKLHIMPRKNPRPANVSARPTSSGGASRRRTPLSRSTSLADGDDGGSAGQDNRSASTKPSIMITRLFTVSLSDHGGGCTHQRPAMSMDERRVEEGEEATVKSIKQKKVPMYAVSIIIQLADESGIRLRQPGLDGQFTPTQSPRRTESFFSFSETRTIPVFDPILRSHANYVLGNWTMLNRNIEILEHTASHSLRHILQAVPTAPRLDLPPTKGTVKTKPPDQQTQQLVYVGPECLQYDDFVKAEAENAARVVVTALRIRKVVVGQDNWGAWREEARWVGRWAARKEQHSFFYHMLTAFLGNHNVWLRSIHTSQYRRRTPLQQQIVPNGNSNIRYRTVIVASDKMAARRFIFLLSHFFPSSMSHYNLQSSSLFGQSFSDNPPSFSLGREKSLRRTINNRRKTSLNGQVGHNRSVSFSVVEHDKEDPHDSSGYNKERRGSDSFSIRTAALTIPNQPARSRKASISTVLAESDAPVPHFSVLEESPGSTGSYRPSSRGSVASLALSQSLKRKDSSNTSNGGRWGSMVSGFWSNRRDSSTSDHDTRGLPQSGSYKILSPSLSESPQKTSQLDQMVKEATQIPPSKDLIGLSITPTKSCSAVEDSPPKPPLPREIPIKKTMRMPLSISFNEDDGFLDVSLSSGQSFQSSFASSLGSFPLGTGSPHDHHSMMSSFASETSRNNAELSIDAAGWLRNYHPNFTLQAVRPYETLIKEIKQSMSDEASITPTPLEVDLRSGRWFDICVTLIADTTTFNIQKLRLCRRKKPGHDPNTSYEEKIFTEPVLDIDNTLVEAVERVLAGSSGSSRSQSRAPSPKPTSTHFESRSSSRPTSRPSSIKCRTPTGILDGRPLAADAPHYETRKTILGALEEVVRSVVEERDLSVGSHDGKGSRKEDNSLRDGVRKWLDGIDEL